MNTEKHYPTPASHVFRKVLLTLESIKSCAESGPTPNPELVAIHGHEAVVNSSFHMIKGMAEHATETIEEMTGISLH